MNDNDIIGEWIVNKPQLDYENEIAKWKEENSKILNSIELPYSYPAFVCAVILSAILTIFFDCSFVCAGFAASLFDEAENKKKALDIEGALTDTKYAVTCNLTSYVYTGICFLVLLIIFLSVMLSCQTC